MFAVHLASICKPLCVNVNCIGFSVHAQGDSETDIDAVVVGWQRTCMGCTCRASDFKDNPFTPSSHTAVSRKGISFHRTSTLRLSQNYFTQR